MKILLSGATGLIGQELRKKLLNQGHTLSILSRTPKPNTAFEGFYIWNPSNGEIDIAAFDGVSAIINLSGAGVADKRWTESYKKEILDSRTQSTGLLIQKLSEINHQVHTFINASAIGYYGYDTGDDWVNEETPVGQDYLANVVLKWEQEAFKANTLGIRTVTIRTGIVLSSKGGALPQMAKPVKYGLGAALGSGKQYVSWIDIDDLVGIFFFCLTNKSSTGSYNATAPNPVTNKEFNLTLAKHYKTQIILPNIPSFLLRLLLGEFSSAVLGGSKVSSKRISDEGFSFSFTSLKQSLNHQKA